MSKLILLAIGLVIPPTLAKTNSVIKLHVKVVFGEQTSQFSIQENLLKLSNSKGLEKSRTLKPADFKYLIERFNSLPSTNQIPNSCHRSYMTITAKIANGKPMSKGSCFGVKSITSAKYEELANLLAASL